MKKKPSIMNWLLVIRPWSFSVSALPAFVAFMYSIHTHATYNWQLGVLAIVGAIIFHAGGNLLSDLNDFKKGVDQIDKQGGTDSLTGGLFTAKQILLYGSSLIAVGILLGVYLVSQTGKELLWIGVIGTIGAVFYSFFKYRALGDFLIFIIYGPTIMLGTGYVMIGSIDWNLFLVSLPMTFITVNVLHANNTRDQRSDRYAEIKTFAMLLGTKASVYHYYFLTGLSYLSVIVMVVFNILPLATLATLLTFPIAYQNCKSMHEAVGEDMNTISNLDLATAKLQTIFSLLMSSALIISSVI